MKVLRDHFNNNPTILLGDQIINGCQAFTLDKADEIIKKLRVPYHVWAKVLDVYTGSSTLEEIESFVNDEDLQVRLAIAQRGYALDHFVIDKAWQVRLVVVLQGYSLDTFVKDPHYLVREAVAHEGYGLSILLDDTHWEVRLAVAQKKYGLYTLMKDPHHLVRRAANRFIKEKLVLFFRMCITSLLSPKQKAVMANAASTLTFR